MASFQNQCGAVTSLGMTFFNFLEVVSFQNDSFVSLVFFHPPFLDVFAPKERLEDQL